MQIGISLIISEIVDLFGAGVSYHKIGSCRQYGGVDIINIRRAAGIPHRLPLILPLVINCGQFEVPVLVGLRAAVGFGFVSYESSSVDIDIAPGLVVPGFLSVGITVKTPFRGFAWIASDYLGVRVAQPFDIDTGALNNRNVPQILGICIRLRVVGQVGVDYVEIYSIDRVVEVVGGVVIHKGVIQHYRCRRVGNPVRRLPFFASLRLVVEIKIV